MISIQKPLESDFKNQNKSLIFSVCLLCAFDSFYLRNRKS